MLGTSFPPPPPPWGSGVVQWAAIMFTSICQNHHQQKEATCLCEQASWQASKGEGGGVRGIREGNGQAVFSHPPSLHAMHLLAGGNFCTCFFMLVVLLFLRQISGPTCSFHFTLSLHQFQVYRKSKEWELLARWSVSFCNETKVYDETDSKLLHLVSWKLWVVLFVLIFKLI